MKKGLSEDERFLESIKSFWEQTLIRELIDSKNREWADKLIVTDEEVRSRYSMMSSRVTLRVIKADDAKEAEAALSAVSAKGELLGPLFVEDLNHSDPLLAAFAMEEGAKAVAGSGDDFFAYEVVKKGPSGVAPLEEVYDALKASLLEEKKEKALEEWLEGRVGSSRCCSVCGESECRTVEVGGTTYEAIPENLILKAALIASSELLDETASSKAPCCTT